MSLIEGAAAGRPAVATAVGGVPDVVAEGTGRLVPAGDWRALGAAVAELGADPELRRRMGERARGHVLPRYAADRLVSDVDQLYRSLLAGRSNGAHAG